MSNTFNLKQSGKQLILALAAVGIINLGAGFTLTQQLLPEQ